MQGSKTDFAELNARFSVDDYLQLDDEERILFRSELKSCIKALQKQYKLKMMTKDDVLSAGMERGNRTALAIIILKERLTPYNYDQTFQLRDAIATLHKSLLEELFGGKNIFYPIDEKTIGIDPNYVPFIISKKFKELRIEN